MAGQGRGNAFAGRVMQILAIVVVFMALVQCAQGVQHVVGGTDKWADPGVNNAFSSSYLNDWASTQTFAPNDTLAFEYTEYTHNVFEVTAVNYPTCVTTSPTGEWATGNDIVTLNGTGMYYFICGFPGHCLNGQKVQINVTSSSSPSTTPSSPSTTPSSPSPPPPPPPNAGTRTAAESTMVVFGAFFVACISLFW